MTVPELYELMRVDAIESSNAWDDLDWASGFHAFEDQALDAEGEFLPWSALPESIQVKLHERLTPWLTRYDT
jgi:hypothetical protein